MSNYIETPFAYCTLVMLGDSYIPGVFALAESLSKSKIPLICMITSCVSEQGVKRLLEATPYVVCVPLIETYVRQMKTPSQRYLYQKWINKSFTKWNLFIYNN